MIIEVFTVDKMELAQRLESGQGKEELTTYLRTQLNRQALQIYVRT